MKPNRLFCSLILIVALLSVPGQMHASCPHQSYSECPGTENGSSGWERLPGHECWEDSECLDTAFFQRDCKVVSYYRDYTDGNQIVVDYVDCYRGCTCILWIPWV